MFSSKKGAASPPMGTGAPFVVVLVLLVVFYIIFLPPADRDALLNSGTVPGEGYTGGNSGVNTGGTSPGYTAPKYGRATVFEQTFKGPGELIREPRTDYTHDISTTTLRGAYQATVLLNANDFVVSRTSLSNKVVGFSIALDNPQDVKNGLLTFGVKNFQDANGILSVRMNGIEVFSGTFNQFNSAPISLAASPFQSVNRVTFEVSAPGIAVWQTNSYEITGLKVKADVIYRESLESSDRFTIDPVEMMNLKNVRLRFVPTCGADSGKLTIVLNENQTIFSKVPDCGSANYVSIPTQAIKAGQNSILFNASYGLYQLDRIQVQTFLNSDQGVSYYFDLPKKWFSITDQKESVCGESDGSCPIGCGQEVDRDCCYNSYETSYWCETPTTVTADRCVGYVDSLTANRCPSAYKDRSGNVAEDFEDLRVCGDNDDNVCPSGCSINYDEDCCLVSGVGNYFCDQLTVGGVTNMCKLSLATEELALCPNGYIEREGGRLSSTYSFGTAGVRNSIIDDNYLVTAEFLFVDDEKDHTAILVINGDRTNFDTRGDRIVKDITRYVESESNYIQIIPQSDFSLVRLIIKVEKR